MLAAANKMNDFQARAGVEGAERPLGFLEDEAVQLDGDAVGFQAERLEEILNGEVVRDVAGLAIDKDLHDSECGDPLRGFDTLFRRSL